MDGELFPAWRVDFESRSPNDFRRVTKIVFADTMESAISMAQRTAQGYDVVLMSASALPTRKAQGVMVTIDWYEDAN